MQKEKHTSESSNVKSSNCLQKECQYISTSGATCKITSSRENSLCNYHYIQSALIEKKNQIFGAEELFDAPEIRNN
jgi:hypothetical protein